MKQKTIWVVDDDHSILEVIEIILLEEGYNVKVIENAHEVFELIKQSTPDLLLLDIFMSGFDGRDISKFLKSQHHTKDIPIIIMSADIQVERKAQEGKANNYLIKPFNVDDLVKLIQNTIR